MWESKRLINLGGALSTFVGTKASSSLLQHFIQHFWFTGILAATSIPSLIITSSAVMDNAWSVALQRSETGGLVLANVLMARAHGDRPVKLYGFSMGARLIFHCLLELYRNGCHGIVEEVVLLGAPVSIRENRWAMARSVIAGRFINGYSKRYGGKLETLLTVFTLHLASLVSHLSVSCFAPHFHNHPSPSPICPCSS